MNGFIACIDCPDREIGCHSTCEKYQHAVDERNRVKENRDKEKMINTYYMERRIKYREDMKKKKFDRRR